ncbi:MAG: FHA domain-containing protein [Gammaproteobacteria bacterium]|nr:FHA domain-containing protein [Gammaproteobacteria bacterium]
MAMDDLYLDHFGFSQHPFRLTPDAEFLYLSDGHARAKACMEQASAHHGAVSIVTGEVGCGKSVLVSCVLAEMPEKVAVARLTQTDLEVDEFLQAVLTQFGFRPFDRGEQAVRTLLDNFLFAQSVRGHRVLLIVEEAQNLSRPTLRELCELAELEEDEQRLLSIVLVGQPSLRDRFDEKELRQLVDRMQGSAHLEPLDFRDTCELIRHRVAVGGLSTMPFDNDTFAQIFRYTGGVPRVIVNLCDTSLTAAYVEESQRVTPALVEAAIEELKLKPVLPQPTEPVPDPAQENEPAQGPPLLASIEIHKHERHLRDIEINNTRVLIGRDSDNDIVLGSEFISRHHAQISMDHEGRFWIKDLNSTNGAFINGRRTQRGRLHDGDVIQLGQHFLVFHNTGSAQARKSSTELDDWRETQVLPSGQAVDGDDADDDTELRVKDRHSGLGR